MSTTARAGCGPQALDNGHAVHRVFQLHDLRAWQPRLFMSQTTDLGPAVQAALNHLLGQPTPTAPNRVWAVDITYLPHQDGGWL